MSKVVLLIAEGRWDCMQFDEVKNTTYVRCNSCFVISEKLYVGEINLQKITVTVDLCKECLERLRE